MSVLYEKGTPSWDIGMLLTRHDAGLPSHHFNICQVVASLRNTVGLRADLRLAAAQAVECTCTPR